MRILYLTGAAALGGAERVLLALVRGMAERGHHVCLLSSQPGALVDAAAPWADTDVVPFPPALAVLGESRRSSAAVMRGLARASGPLIGYVGRLRAAVRAWAPDVVHSNGTKVHVVTAALPGGTPMIWHLHEYVGTRPISRRLLRAAAGRGTSAIAISHSVAADFSRCVPAVPVEIVHNAVDLARFAPEGHACDLDRTAGLPPAEPGTVRIGLVATFAWWKGHDVFLRALARLPRDLPFRGYIVGGPVYDTGAGSQISRGAIEAELGPLGLIGRVGLTGFVDDVGAVMRGLDVVVHASTQPEPFGLVIAEAMAAGRPVVVSAAGGALEIVRPGEDALVYQPGNDAELSSALQGLIARPALREALARAARSSALARFDPRRFGEDVERVYRRTLGARR